LLSEQSHGDSEHGVGKNVFPAAFPLPTIALILLSYSELAIGQNAIMMTTIAVWTIAIMIGIRERISADLKEMRSRAERIWQIVYQMYSTPAVAPW
jgi:hypothetical protein